MKIHQKCPREFTHFVHENLPFLSMRILLPLFLVIFKIENKKIFTPLCFLASALSFQQIAYKSRKLLPSASS